MFNQLGELHAPLALFRRKAFKVLGRTRRNRQAALDGRARI
jgi:hypothetical protein